jgi:hypothetical protein
MSERKGATLWVSSPAVRDRINKKKRKGETVEEMLRRKGVI